MERITSKTNDKIKFAVRLRDSAKLRREEGLFLIEGARLCADASGSVEVVRSFMTADAIEKYPQETERLIAVSGEVFEINREVSEKLSDTFSPQGVFSLCKTIDKKLYIDKIYSNHKIIALERIQDPSNLGAVCRTAEALGIDAAIVSGCCDIYNPKAQRAAMGSLLRLPILETANLPEAIAAFSQKGFLTLVSVPDSKAEKITEVDMSGKVLCVIGNEGAGVTPETSTACAKRVTIPMLGRAESLNASAAAAIIIWELMR